MPARAADWLWLDSPHFEMLADTDEKTARQLLIELEQFRAVFLEFMGAEPEIGMRTTVVFFSREQDFERYKPQYRGRTKSVAGFFTGSAINGFMAIGRATNLAETKRVIYHEYVHSLYHETGWSPPLWLNEGTAELFSTYTVKKGVAYLGEAPTAHVGILREHRLMPLGRLMTVGHQSPEYNETQKQGIFYAESWALAHFLICNSDLSWRSRLNAFLPRITDGVVSEADFRAALGVGFGDMEKLLDTYIYGGRYLIYKNTVPEEKIASTLVVRKAAGDERDVVLQLLEAFGRDSSAADYQLLVLADKFPQSARVREAIASRALQAGDEERAKDYMERAVELGTTNIQVRWFLGQQLLRAWLRRDIGPQKRLGADETARLREIFSQVILENPRAVDAWEALARTEAFSPLPDRATVEKIHAMCDTAPTDPRLLQARMLAGFAYKRLGDLTQAEKIAREVDAAPATDKGTRAFNRLLLGELLARP